MFVEERKREILKVLASQKKVKTLELSQLFNVSEPTIRRDISEMDQQGLLIRTHGGAMALDQSESEPSYTDKIERSSKEKSDIGILAASLIKDNDTVVLDSGTTTVAIARNIRARHVTVVTNSLDVAAVLQENSDVEVVMTGGQVRWNTRAMVGTMAEKVLDSMRVNIALIGTNAFSQAGFMTPNLTEGQTKAKMIQIADKAFIVTDSSKYNKTSLSMFAKPSDISGIISDQNLPEEFIAFCEENEIDVIVKAGENNDSYSNS